MDKSKMILFKEFLKSTVKEAVREELKEVKSLLESINKGDDNQENIITEEKKLTESRTSLDEIFGGGNKNSPMLTEEGKKLTPEEVKSNIQQMGMNDALKSIFLETLDKGVSKS